MTERGFCECGCGQKTQVAPQTRAKLGWIRGQPIRFVVGHANNGKRQPIAQRLWAKVRKSDSCWLWTGARQAFGYGVIGVGGRADGVARTHRVSYELAYGSIPDGMEVCHRCDIPACVRPEHLFLGTRQDNTDDAVAKHRMATAESHGMHTHPQRRSRGEAHGASKLTEANVISIRQKYAAGGISQSQLATEFGVQQMAISEVVRRQTWTHI